MASSSPSDSFEARLREMAADRLHETVQFAKSKEESVECGSTTALLLSMAQTLRVCMRDWPNMEDNSLAGVERVEALNDFKRSLKEARRLTRLSALDSLVFVCSDALFLMAEQWPAVKTAATETITETFPQNKRSLPPAFRSMDDGNAKRARFGNGANETIRATTQFYPPYPEEDDSDHNQSGGQEIDPFAIFNQNLNGLIKEEDTTEMSNAGRSDTTIGQTDHDIWSTQNPLAAFAAVTSSTSHASNERESEGTSRIRVNRLFCPECGVGCVAKSQLDAHMNSHTGNRPFQCQYCDKNYKRKDHLSDHIKKNHPVEHAAAKQKKEEMKNKSSLM